MARILLEWNQYGKNDDWKWNGSLPYKYGLNAPCGSYS